MFTPTRTASTGATPCVAAIGSRSNVAGRLFTRLDNTAATPATASRSTSDAPAGNRCGTTCPRPWSLTARTTTPNASTNAQNCGAAETMTCHGCVCLASTRFPASTTAPPTAAHTGATPANDVTTKPANVSASTPPANRGNGNGGPAARTASTDTSARKNTRRTTNVTASVTSHGSAIRAANRVNEIGTTATASRLVRFDTGSSNEPELAMCAQA